MVVVDYNAVVVDYTMVSVDSTAIMAEVSFFVVAILLSQSMHP